MRRTWRGHVSPRLAQQNFLAIVDFPAPAGPIEPENNSRLVFFPKARDPIHDFIDDSGFGCGDGTWVGRMCHWCRGMRWAQLVGPGDLQTRLSNQLIKSELSSLLDTTCIYCPLHERSTSMLLPLKSVISL